MSINETLMYQVSSTADWRRTKAEQFPEDTRNEEAAELLDHLSEEIDKLDGTEIESRIDALWDRWRELNNNGAYSVHEKFNELVSAELRDVGFRGGHESGAEFLKWYCDTFEELIADCVNDDDDGIESPDLDAQVDKDEAVTAAKKAYEEASKAYQEARAKAYAEARKRL
jgi:hypothetical protein